MNKYFKKLKKITEYITEKRKDGWLLIDKRDKECETDQFVIKYGDEEKSISFFHQTGRNTIHGVIVSDIFTIYGESFKKECEMAYTDFINTYYLLEPKTIHKLDELNI